LSGARPPWIMKPPRSRGTRGGFLRQLTQVEAGKVLGIRQPNVSRLMRGSSGLTAPGHDVEVVITPTRRKHGRLSVVVAA